MPDFNSNGIDDVEEVEQSLTKRGLTVLAWMWHAFWKLADGVKTLFAGSALFFIGLIDEFGGMDLLQNLKSQADTDNPKLGRWLMAVIVLFIVLRFVTTGPVFKGASGQADSAKGDDGETN